VEQLAPDWWTRGVTRPGRRNTPLRDLSENASKGGGAKNGAEKRAQPRATKGADEEDSCAWLVPVGFLVPFDPASLLFLPSLWILARALESLERARSRCSSERGDSAGKPRPFPKTPSVLSSGPHVRREARARGPRRRSSELRSREKDSTRKGSRDFCFFWVLCKCVCVAPVYQVELFKCSRVTIIFGCSSALCPCFCFFALTVYVHENCC